MRLGSIVFKIHRFLRALNGPNRPFTRKGRRIASADFDGIDTGFSKPGHDLFAFFKGQAAVFHEIGTVQLDPNGVVRTDGLSYSRDGF